MPSPLIKQLADLLAKRSYSYREIEERTGVPKTLLHRIATGTGGDMRISSIERVAAVCGRIVTLTTGTT
jgi:DNA-binding Xre family transcriptional regulator